MPQGQVVGRISIKVLPDTSEFREELKNDLRRIENDLKVTVKATLDATQLKAELKKIENELGSIKVKVTADTSQLDESLKDVKVNASINTERISQDLDRIGSDLESWRDDHDPLEIGIEPDMMPGATALASARLGILTRARTVRIIPVLDSAAMSSVMTALAALSGARVLGDLMENLWNIGKEFDRLVPKIGAGALAIGGLFTSIMSGVSNVFALALALAEMTSAALTLPGLFGGMAVGAGIFVVALTTMKDQMPELMEVFSEMRELIGQNFWAEAGKGALQLAQQYLPLVGETATHLGKLFGGLGTSLVESFKGALPGMFDNLNSSIDILTQNTGLFASIISTLGTVGAEYLPRLSTFIVDSAEKFSGFLEGAKADGSLKGFIESGIQGFKDLGSIIVNTVKVIGDIGRAAQAGGGATLGMLADTMERIQAVTSSPAFQTGMTTVFMTAHSVMSQIAATAGPALMNLFSQLAATLAVIGPALGVGLGTAIGAIATALANPALQAGIQTVFVAMNNAIQALEPAMMPLSNAIAALAPVFAALLSVIAPLITAALIPLSEIVQTLAPQFVPLIQLLGGALIEAIQLLAPKLQEIAEKFVEIVKQAMPVITTLLNILIPVFGFLVDIIATTVLSILNGLGNAFEGITRIFQGFSTMFSGGWANFWAGIKEVLAGAWELLKGIIEVALNVGVLGIFKKGITALKTFWDEGWTAIKDAVFMIWDGIKNLFRLFMEGIETAARGYLGFYKEIFSTAWNAIKGVIEGIWRVIKLLISEGMGAVKGFIDDGWSTINAIVGTATTKMKTAIKNGIDDAIDFVKGLPGKAKDALGNVGSTLFEAGKDLIEGFIRGITSLISRVRDTLGDLTARLRDWKGPESTDKTLLYNAGQLVIGGFISGLESKYGAVRKSLQGLSGDVGDFTVQAPNMGNVAALVDGGISTGVGTQKVFNYYAAPGNTFNSEEELFAAAGRARMVGW